MNDVSKTLYIPLYGKAFVSRLGILLHDPKAEEIWAAEGFPLKGKAKSKWLAYHMGMRSAVFDVWLREKLSALPDAVVVHVGCGMDSRCLRVAARGHRWFDIDFPEVIAQRRRFFSETDSYRMVAADIRDEAWLQQLPKNVPAVIVMEGVSMYLTGEARNDVLARWAAHFSPVHLLMDVYTTFAAKATKYKNPINEVGVTEVFGIDAPDEITAMSFVAEHSLTPDSMIAQLKPSEQWFFRRFFAGKLAKNIYRLYEYRA